MKIKILYLVIIAYTKRSDIKMADDTKRLNVVISSELHRDLKVEVAKNGMTIAQFVAEAIAEKIQKEKGSSN